MLILSDASLYVLQNYMALDVEFKARWADQILEHGYVPVSEESPSYGDWVDLVDQIQREVIDMSCDIVGALDAIRASIDALAGLVEAQGTEQSGWDDLWTDLLLPLAEVATGADVLGLTAAIQQNQLQCCDALQGTPYYPGVGNEVSNPGTSSFCQRADSMALDWEQAAGELWKKTQVVSQIGIGLLSIIVAALSLPIAVLTAIVGLIVGGLTALVEEEYLDYFADLRFDIRCAIYNSLNSTEAKQAVDNAIDALPGNLTAIEKTVLKYLVGIDALNAVFDESYQIRADATTDCSSCFEGLDCLTFDAHTYDFQEDAPPNDCGSFNWSSLGHLASGCIHLFIGNGCDSEIVYTELYGGTVVSTGDAFTCWAKGTGPDAFNVAFHINYVEGGGLSDLRVVVDSDWEQISLPIPVGDNGKHINRVSVQVQKSLNSQSRDGWFDEICYTPA